LRIVPKRVRTVFNGETVADSRRVKLMHETGHLPVYYFPEEDIRGDLLEPTDHTTHCPFKGDASYRSVRVGDSVAENAVWNYPEPAEHFAPLAGYAASMRRGWTPGTRRTRRSSAIPMTPTIGWTSSRAPGTSKSA
jgi:uncharacterized protein (DUF427 family)